MSKVKRNILIIIPVSIVGLFVLLNIFWLIYVQAAFVPLKKGLDGSDDFSAFTYVSDIIKRNKSESYSVKSVDYETEKDPDDEDKVLFMVQFPDYLKFEGYYSVGTLRVDKHFFKEKEEFRVETTFDENMTVETSGGDKNLDTMTYETTFYLNEDGSYYDYRCLIPFDSKEEENKKVPELFEENKDKLNQYRELIDSTFGE